MFPGHRVCCRKAVDFPLGKGVGNPVLNSDCFASGRAVPALRMWSGTSLELEIYYLLPGRVNCYFPYQKSLFSKAGNKVSKLNLA